MTINRWYGIGFDRDSACPICGDFITATAIAHGIDMKLNCYSNEGIENGGDLARSSMWTSTQITRMGLEHQLLQVHGFTQFSVYHHATTNTYSASGTTSSNAGYKYSLCIPIPAGEFWRATTVTEHGREDQLAFKQQEMFGWTSFPVFRSLPIRAPSTYQIAKPTNGWRLTRRVRSRLR